MASLYRRADIVMNPSLADNMPNSLLEAWASGVPVVSTNVGGIPYLARGDAAPAIAKIELPCSASERSNR